MGRIAKKQVRHPKRLPKGELRKKPEIREGKGQEHSLQETLEEKKPALPERRKFDIFIPQESVPLDAVTIEEPRETLRELPKSLESLVLTAPTTQGADDEKLNYGPRGAGKFYESGNYKSAKYEEAAKYTATTEVEPALASLPSEGRYTGMHTSDHVFERFTEMKKKEEGATQYKKRGDK